jgi:hypothetical protein
MTRLPQPEQWVFTHDTQLESGKHQIDGYDLNGLPVRLCRKQQPLPGMHAFINANGPEEND